MKETLSMLINTGIVLAGTYALFSIVTVSSSQAEGPSMMEVAQRLYLKGKLITNYRAAQPAVDACNREQGEEPHPPEDDPFLVQEAWEDELY